jgi:hypothetical protein
MKLVTKFQPLMPLQTTDLTASFKYLHLWQTLDLFFSAWVLDSLSFSKNVSGPTEIVLHMWNLSWLFIMLNFTKVVMDFPFRLHICFKKIISYGNDTIFFFLVFIISYLKYFIKNKLKIWESPYQLLFMIVWQVQNQIFIQKHWNLWKKIQILESQVFLN